MSPASSDELVHRHNRQHDREDEHQYDRAHRDNHQRLHQRRDPVQPALGLALEVGGGALEHRGERAAALTARGQVDEHRLHWIAALVQPLMIVAMGAIVLVLVLAIMLPIVSMNQLIR